MMLGAALQASAGFGSGLVAVPILGLIDTRLVPGPIIFAYVFLTAFMAWRERQNLSTYHIKNIVFGLLMGSFVAFIILLNFKTDGLPAIAAILVLIGVGLSLQNKSIDLNPRNLIAAGSASGFMSALAGLSGPPLAMILQYQKAPFIRANLASCFLITSLLSMCSLFFSGHFSIEDIALGACLLPGIFIGYLLGVPISKRISQANSRKIILIISSLSALSLLMKVLLPKII